MLSSHPWGAGKDRIFTTELQGKHHALILKSHMSREHLILSVCDSRYAQYLLIKLHLKIPYCSFSGSLPYFSPFLTSLLTTGCCDIECFLSLEFGHLHESLGDCAPPALPRITSPGPSGSANLWVHAAGLCLPPSPSSSFN